MIGPAPPSSNQDITGVILAGGDGRRMRGRDKAWLCYRSQPMLCHAWRLLQAQTGTVVVGSLRHGWAYRRLGIGHVADFGGRRGRGPLAAIAGALVRWPQRWLAFMPVDTPEAPSDFVTQLRAALVPGCGAVALIGEGRRQPLFSLLSGELADDAVAAVQRSEPPSVQAWLQSVGVRWIEVNAPEGAFANINTYDDRDRLEQRHRGWTHD